MAVQMITELILSFSLLVENEGRPPCVVESEICKQ